MLCLFAPSLFAAQSPHTNHSFINNKPVHAIIHITLADTLTVAQSDSLLIAPTTQGLPCASIITAKVAQPKPLGKLRSKPKPTTLKTNSISYTKVLTHLQQKTKTTRHYHTTKSQSPFRAPMMDHELKILMIMVVVIAALILTFWLLRGTINIWFFLGIIVAAFFFFLIKRLLRKKA